MAAFVKELKSAYDLALQAADPRVEEWHLMSSPLPMLAIIVVYNFFVMYFGPKMMENREPMNLKKVMIVYNLFLVLLNVWFVQASLRHVWLVGRFHLYKEPIDYSMDPFAVYIAGMVWWFFISKIFDLLDTVFIVLRKKSNQLSFLHTYHHSATIIVIWLSVKYIAGGSVIIVGSVNGFVHILMYTYYLLTLIDPEYKKSIWFKRRLTEIQLVQFVFLSIVGCLIAYHSDRTLVKVVTGLCVPQNAFFFFMFLDFYHKTYLNKKILASKSD